MADIDFKVGVQVETTGEDKIDQLEKQIEKLKSSKVNLDFNVTGNGAEFVTYFTQIQKQAQQTGKAVQNSMQQAFGKIDISKYTKGQVNALNEIKTTAKSIADDVSKTLNDAGKKEQKTVSKNIAKDYLKITKELERSQERIGRLQGNMDKTTSKYGNTSKFKDMENNLNRIAQLYTKINLEGSKDSPNIDRINADLKEMNSLISKSETAFNNLTKPISKLDAELAAEKTKGYLRSNTKAIKEMGDQFDALAEKQRKATTKGELEAYKKEYDALVNTTRARGLTGKSWFEDFKRGFKQIAQFAGTYGILQNVMQDLPRAMVKNVSDVDAAMKDLRMATSVSKTEAVELMKTYSNMGKELKVLGTDVAKSSTEWLKQGKSIKEADKLTKDSLILSKIGDMSSEDATKTITAAMKSYDLTTEQIGSFVDKISAIDMASATNVKGLSEAFNEVAANAKQAGVESEKVLAYAATIGETTQEGMSSVGTSLNAIFSRMGNIKLSRLKDFETGEDLSNVETVLRKVGISLRDGAGQFREFDNVLDETASKWENFDSVTQRAVANAFSGTHHANSFMVLMQNYEKAQEYMNIAGASSGQSAQKFEAYQESLAGSVEGFKNAFQSLSNTTLDSGFLTGFVNAGAGLLNFLDSAIEKFGVFKSLLAVGGGIFAQKNGLGKRNAIPYKVKQNIAVSLT